MFFAIVGLMTCLLVDTTFIKLYDVVSKNFLSIESKTIIFSLTVSICLLLLLIVLQYANKLMKKNQVGNTISFRSYSKFVQISYYWLIFLVSSLIFELVYLGYYDSIVLMLIIITTYGIASVLIGKISLLFMSWYRTSHDFTILMYFISMSLIVFNLVMTSLIVNINLSDRPERLREFAGGSMDLSAGKYDFLAFLHRISTVVSFLSIWLTTSLLTFSSRDRLRKKIRYWVMPIMLLVYFLVSYFSQSILNPILAPLLYSDPILVSLSLILVFSLIKPVGGIMFGIAFWNISRTVRYEKTLRDYMVISGYGFLLLFSANQSTSLVLGPYPPFGIATISILIVGAYLIMIGIYNSAILVSTNIDLRKSIQKIARESKLLHLIGKAEMEKEMDKTVTKIIEQTGASEDSMKSRYDLDEQEIKTYLEEALEELKKNKNKDKNSDDY
jgi:hypothetical protein